MRSEFRSGCKKNRASDGVMELLFCLVQQKPLQSRYSPGLFLATSELMISVTRSGSSHALLLVDGDDAPSAWAWYTDSNATNRSGKDGWIEGVSVELSTETESRQRAPLGLLHTDLSRHSLPKAGLSLPSPCIH
jgi:hypothetical protein